MSEIKKIAIFASGKGSLTEHIIRSFNNSNIIISYIITNNSNSGVIEIAKSNNIEYIILDKKADLVTKLLGIDLIVLAGYIKKISEDLISKFKIVNIHPSLLPNFGGKGMYGINVHKAIIDSRELFSGITIHWVNKEYDDGKFILNQQIQIQPNWTEFDLEREIKSLERKWYPEIIKQILFDNRR